MDVILFTSASNPSGRDIRRGHAAGAYVKLKRGAYIATSTWTALPPLRQHRARAIAYSRSHSSLVLSHWSAAAILGLPVVGGWPRDVHVTVPRHSTARSEPGLRRHSADLTDDSVVEVEGLTVTSLPRTLSDLAAVQPFRFSSTPLDAALHSGLVDTDGLLEELDRRAHDRRIRRIRRAFDFADGAAESPGESLSRATIAELGFPPPRLQTPFVIGARRYRVDFDWPDFGVCGEFDGRGKYTRDAPARADADVVWEEKKREDLIRSTYDRRFARWLWDDAFRAEGLQQKLRAAGLPQLGGHVVALSG